LAVGHHGPAVLGINWYTAMMDTDEEGFVSVAGKVEGGHAILCNGVSVKREKFFLSNSWGLSWGLSGGCWVSFGANGTTAHRGRRSRCPGQTLAWQRTLTQDQLKLWHLDELLNASASHGSSTDGSAEAAGRRRGRACGDPGSDRAARLDPRAGVPQPRLTSAVAVPRGLDMNQPRETTKPRNQRKMIRLPRRVPASVAS
jgi:hypothetical protein